MSTISTAIFIVGLCIITAEWVEITQKPKPSSDSKAEGVTFTESAEPLTPSPVWIEYQRERYGNKHKISTQQFTVSAEQPLKTSAQVIVPAKTTQVDPPRNKIVQVKTRIEVAKSTSQSVIDKVEPELVHEESQTTPRRDMSYDDEETETEEPEEDQWYDADEETTTTENTNSAVEYPTVKGFLKFLKSIQQSWLKKSSFSIDQKINTLKKLRDKLMRTIERQFTTLWQKKERQRHKRGILDESNLNFPPEAALMSINFLTFAVFLIKLVLQVVHIIKSKHYSLSGFGMNTDAVRKTTMRH